MKKNMLFSFLILLSTIFILCTKSEKTEISGFNDFDIIEHAKNLDKTMSSYVGDLIPHYENINCIPENCIEIEDHEVLISPICNLIPSNIIGDCKVIAMYDICVDENTQTPYISFYNFTLGIPSIGDCSSLYNYLENLSEQDRINAINCIAEYVKIEGINQTMAAWTHVPCNSNFQVATADFYEAMCSKICRVGFSSKGPEGPSGLYENKLISRVSEEGWWYYFVACGTGCCLSEITYCYDENQNFIISGPTTISYGECDYNSPSQWEFEHCFDEVEPCKSRCNF